MLALLDVLGAVDAQSFALIIAAVLGAGGIGGVVAFRKAGPEMEATTVATLRSVIDELRTEVQRLAHENAELRLTVERLEFDVRQGRALRDRLEQLDPDFFRFADPPT